MKKHIYILQLYSQTIPSRIVRFIIKYKYSHIGICLDKKCDVIYSFGRRSLNNFLDGGFVVERKDGAFFKKFSNTICRIYELEIENSKYIEIKKQLDYMMKKSKIYKYDFLGLFLRLFNIKISFKNYYVCSQFVAELLDKYGIYKFDKEVCFIKPNDFEKIKGIKNIYEGEYLSY